MVVYMGSAGTDAMHGFAMWYANLKLKLRTLATDTAGQRLQDHRAHVWSLRCSATDRALLALQSDALFVKDTAWITCSSCVTLSEKLDIVLRTTEQTLLFSARMQAMSR